MIEIPESAVLALQLQQAIQGKTLRRVIANASPHKFAFFTGDPETYDARLRGRQIRNIYALGGLIEMDLGALRLVFGEGVRFHLFSKDDEIPKKHQLLLEFDDGTVLICSTQMYGGYHIYDSKETDNMYYQVACEKPSPLTDDFSFTYFQTLTYDANPALSAKAFLATEQRIPGLGNGVLQDILFHAHLHPKRKLRELSASDIERLYQSLKTVLCDMVIHGGRDTERDIMGKPGGYQTILSSKTYQSPCPVCHGPIVRQAYLGGTVYFCPVCQPLGKEASKQ